MRMGYDALDQSARIFKESVGNPRLCTVILRRSCDSDLVELLRRQLVDAGFTVCLHELAEDAARTIDEASVLFETFAREGVNAEDLCCALGDADVLSLASFVCDHWGGGVSLVAIPEGVTAFFEGTLVPRALDAYGKHEMVAVNSCARRVILDYNIFLSDYESEDNAYARSLMIACAMAGSERDFSTLWDRAEAIARGSEGPMIDQILETAKGRGQIISSTAAAVRHSIEYGRTFARALESLYPGRFPSSLLLAEGMRFAARLSVGLEKLSVDDMLAQDELLETLGLNTISCDAADPSQLVEAIRAELSLRTNRMMLLVPYALGRVRLSSIPEDLLYEHAAAWCGAHVLPEE